MPTFPFRSPARPSRPIAPRTPRPLISPTAWASTKKAYNTVMAPVIPIMEEAAHNKMVDDMGKMMFPEKKENTGTTPGPPPALEHVKEKAEKHEHDGDATVGFSLLEGLEPEHLPWSKEVHLVEHVDGFRKTYAAVVVILREIESTEISDDEEHLEPVSHPESVAQHLVSSDPHPTPGSPPTAAHSDPVPVPWGTPIPGSNSPRPGRPW